MTGSITPTTRSMCAGATASAGRIRKRSACASPIGSGSIARWRSRRGEYDYLLPSFAGDELLLGTWITASDGKLTMQRSFQLIRPRDRAIIMRGRWELVSIELSSGCRGACPLNSSMSHHRALIAAPPQSASDGARQE
ncbi:MAG: hypothetical protein MZV49_20650 [Rhodopseudomonas palustris]|nr:hypothetical protein [Rhodopseudomonas palustris]